MSYKRLKKSNLDLIKKENNFLDIFLALSELKNTLRTGWIKYHNLEEKYGESVADHSFAMAGMSYLLAQELNLNLDFDKVLKMSLFHELGEIYGGDIVSYNNRDMNKEEKENIEKKSFQKFLTLLNNEKLKSELWDLYLEFEESESMEAKFVKSMDQLEATFQAWLYEKNNVVRKSVLEFKEYALSVTKKNEQKELIEILENLNFKFSHK